MDKSNNKSLFLFVCLRLFVILSTLSNCYSFLHKSDEYPFSQPSYEKKPPTFHYTGWLIGILIMVYYNPYMIG